MKRTWDSRRNITTDLAYIAGLFDGEGCVRIKKSNDRGNSYYLIAHITNSEYDMLEFVQVRFGGKIYKQERTPNKTIWQYYLTCGEAEAFLKSIRSFTIGKLKQIDLGLWFHENYPDLTPTQRSETYMKLRAMKKENPELLENKSNGK